MRRRRVRLGRAKPRRFLSGEAKSRRARLRGIVLIARVLFVWAVVAVAAGPGLAQDGTNGRRIVRSISFEGNQAVDDYTLEISIATSESKTIFARTSWLRWLPFGEKRYLNETELRRDVLRILLLYRQSGFLEAQVDTVVSRTSSDVGVRFLIHEGEPVRIAALTVSGAEAVLPNRNLERLLPLRVGDAFNRFLLRASADTIRGALRNRGHPHAEVFRNFDVDADAHEARIQFEVDPGPRAFVGDVRVNGTNRVDEAVVRRMLAIQPGQPFNQEALYESQRDLYRMDIFGYVDVGLEDSVPPEDGDSLVDIRVQVSEGALHQVRGGAGYGTNDCIRTLTSWTARAFLGGARSFELNARTSKIGTGPPFDWGLQRNVCLGLRDEEDSDQGRERLKLNYNVSATLREPFFFSRRTQAAVSLFAERRSEINAFLSDAVGGEVSLSRRMFRDVPITLSYTLSYGRTQAEPAIYCSFLNLCLADDAVFSGRRVQSTVGLSAIWNRANSPLDPTRGFVMTVQLSHASDLTGSDSLSQFNKGIFEVASYHPVSRRTVFAWRVRVGGILSPRFGFAGQSVRFVPPQERFYAGGPSTVRGFGQNELGPVVRVVDTVVVDTLSGEGRVLDRTSPTGGNQVVIANAEFRFPLPGFGGRLRGAVFVDAGQVLERGQTLVTLEGTRVTPGAGLRLRTPLGPIRLDVAYNPYDPVAGPLYRVVGTELVLLDRAFRPSPGSRLQVNFSIGQAF